MTGLRHVLIAALLVLAGCVPIYRNHGYVPPELDLAQVVVGQTNVGELPALIGEPSAQGLLTGSGWYYVGSRWRHYGARAPQEVERQVVAISLNETGTVTNVERFGLERGRVVVLSRRVTDSGITEVSFIRQILGNIGTFTAGDFIRDDS
ncbi:outer membrane protein assembly factor BamE [Paracoccus sp. TK19116]|uniref:Outer membrane protein assembly factor BamE n=1 Tax=Paracoccus albicereus TaxID=2922394 RepID=A0ABT1MQ53_9RHOB|nr:outer membrane protein assembly factor BamE [Paracoccus albicereus]MCQ0970331.1 outer membrane protein assembly factor BamE [Paracoccus albicereus]